MFFHYTRSACPVVMSPVLINQSPNNLFTIPSCKPIKVSGHVTAVCPVCTLYTCTTPCILCTCVYLISSYSRFQTCYVSKEISLHVSALIYHNGNLCTVRQTLAMAMLTQLPNNVSAASPAGHNSIPSLLKNNGAVSITHILLL